MTIRAVSGGWIKNGRGSAGGASLSLNFLNGITDYRITYSGGTNGTRVNSAGLIVAAVAPRYDYNPVTLAARGLLVEEARTNLLLYSQEFEQVNWPRFGTTSITANAATSPDGTNNADLLTFTSAGAGMFQAVVGAASTAYSGTIYMRAAAPVTVNFLLTTNLADPVIVACAVTTTWQRFTVNKTTSIGTTVVAAQVQDSGAGGTNVYLWGAQLEAGSFPTSYIPTTTAAVTRTADSAVMTGADFSSWYNQSEGTFVVKASSLNVTTYKPLIQIDSSLTERIYLDQNSGAMRLIAVNAGVNDIVITLATVSANTPFTEGATYKVNDYAAALNGAAPVVDTSGLVPVTNTFRIGSDSVNRWNGHIQTIQYFPRRAANTQLQAMTL